MLQCAADAQYGIPTRCLCGSQIINEVRGKEEYDSLPGKRFFTCKNYEVNDSELCIPFQFVLVICLWIILISICYVVTKDDGLHFRHLWVFGVQEEIESLTKRVKESEEVILLMAKLNKQIETLEVSMLLFLDNTVVVSFYVDDNSDICECFLFFQEQVHDLNVKVRVPQKVCFN